MLFQVLDNKKYCVGIYYDGKLLYDKLPNGLTHTWSYADFLKDYNIEYANLYCEGKNLTEICPPYYIDDWKVITNKLKAFHFSFREAKINLRELCFYDLVPERYLLELCKIKNEITKYVFKTYQKPDNYDFLLSLTKFVSDISNQKLNIKCLKGEQKKGATKHYIDYNIFGTRTGRLSIFKHSFPILYLKKEDRDILCPTNDFFIELDYNAAELRMLLSLSNKEQPEEDLHEWNKNNIFKKDMSRRELKVETYRWMYNDKVHNDELSKYYGIEMVRNTYWDGATVKTPYKRKISSDLHHALSYILQSTLSDMVLEQAMSIHEFLKDKKSKITATIHDSILIDVAKEEKEEIKRISEIFSNTRFGKFKTNIKYGRNFGEMNCL